MIIVIAGTPGSGKTTVAEMLAKRQGMNIISSGLIFREEALRRGLTLAEFGALAQKNHKIDMDLDRRVTEMILERYRSEDIVVDSRLQAFFLKRENVKFFAAYVDAPLKARAERIAKREVKSVEQVTLEIEEREKSEKSRYQTIYKVDISDKSIYDVIVDSGDKSPDQVVDLIWSQVPR